MKGLLIKDILGMRRYFRTLAIICIFFVLLSFLLKTVTYVSSMLSVIFLMLPLTVFSYDEFAKWDAYGLTLPVTRNQVVLGRYAMTLIMLVVGAAIGLAISAVLTFVPEMDGTLTDVISVITLISSAGLVVLAIVLPLIYKFGAEKGRYVMIGVFLAVFILVFLLSKANMPISAEQLLSNLVWLLPVVGLLLFALSYFVACRVYHKKEI